MERKRFIPCLSWGCVMMAIWQLQIWFWRKLFKCPSNELGSLACIFRRKSSTRVLTNLWQLWHSNFHSRIVKKLSSISFNFSSMTLSMKVLQQQTLYSEYKSNATHTRHYLTDVGVTLMCVHKSFVPYQIRNFKRYSVLEKNFHIFQYLVRVKVATPFILHKEVCH